MAKQMKSYRLDEYTVYSVRNVAEKFGMTDTAVIEMAIDWLYDSGAVYGLENARRGIGFVKSVPATLHESASDEVICTVRANIWNNAGSLYGDNLLRSEGNV